jgi:hypothetical protein
MQSEGKIGFRGEATFTVVGPDGNVKEKKAQKNLVVTAGLVAIADRLSNASPASSLLIGYIAVGDDNTAAASGDTTLGNEIARKAVQSRTQSGGVVAVSTTFAVGDIPGVPTTVQEAAVFIEGTGAADSGTLLCHVVESIAVGALDSLFIDWRITLADA